MAHPRPEGDIAEGEDVWHQEPGFHGQADRFCRCCRIARQTAMMTRAGEAPVAVATSKGKKASHHESNFGTADCCLDSPDTTSNIICSKFCPFVLPLSLSRVPKMESLCRCQCVQDISRRAMTYQLKEVSGNFQRLHLVF